MSLKSLIKRLGPGVITGAADDDPSGIATYSQAGAQTGFGLLWTVVLTWPMMVAVQSISARIGRVTGRGLAANMIDVFPRPVVGVLVALLFVANTINIGADLSAMGAAVKLAVGGSQHLYTVLFALGCLIGTVFIPYHRYVDVLKWLTFSLFAYVGIVFTVHLDWHEVAKGALLPRFELSGNSLTLVVAVFGTTISPYLFFWQSSQEVEEEEANSEEAPLLEKPKQAPGQLQRIAWETGVGMGMSNLVAFFIMLTTAATLHANGQTDIQSTEQAAQALKPIAGEFAFILFSIGIIGTGLLAVPVLAGSVAYAAGELFAWPTGLEHPPQKARGILLRDRRGHRSRHRRRSLAARSDQGAGLERRRQRRDRRAGPGRHDDRGVEIQADGRVRRNAHPACIRLAHHADDGGRGGGDVRHDVTQGRL